MPEMERTSMSQPADWWAAFREQADKEGMNVSEWIGEAAKARLPKQVASKLSKRPPAHRPKKRPEKV